MTDFFLAQLEREAGPTRRTVERVPEGRYDWVPHPKSMTFGYLAELVARMPGWIALAVNQDALDLNPPGGKPVMPKLLTGRDLAEAVDKAVAESRAALTATNDDHLLKTWRLLVGGKVVMEEPRHVVIADTFTHLAHHRGQLTVYLRLNSTPVPSIYGPSADEGKFA